MARTKSYHCTILRTVTALCIAAIARCNITEQLERIAGSDGNMLVIHATCGYLEFTTNCVASLKRLEVRNFLIVADDEAAYEYLLHSYSDQVILTSDIVSRAGSSDRGQFAEFGSPEFTELTNMRATVWLELVKLGYNVLAIDSDMVLLKNPWTTLPLLYDLILVGDSDPGDDGPDMDEEKETNICTCFLFMRSGPGIVALLEEWRHVLTQNPSDWEQQVFSKVFRSQPWNVTHYFLPRRTHPNGQLVRRESYDMMHTNGVARPHISHANYVKGHLAKKDHFLAQGLWEPAVDVPRKCTHGHGLSHVHRHAAPHKRA